MKANEYNPVHVHQGNLFTGLSSVMILKLPTNYGVEYSAADKPQNGKLQLLGSASGQFAKVDYQPILKERDFYVFPYDMRHCVIHLIQRMKSDVHLQETAMYIITQ
jgi:hypothetical protein